MYDVVLLTENRYLNPENPDWYVRQILLEDGLVEKALISNGLRTTRLTWDDPNFNWSETSYALFRTTWDYFHRFQKFKSWLSDSSLKTRFINPIETILWNLDKHYMGDLQRKGVRIVPTHFIPAKDHSSLSSWFSKCDKIKCVVKPVVSGGARNTFVVHEDNLGELEQSFHSLIEKEAYMIQPFQKNIVEQGEISLMCIAGEVTHAVLKIAKEGDFRVQDDFGGTVHIHKPTSEEIDFARKAIYACEQLPVYARVDVVYDNDGQLALCELELIEPEMWFRQLPEAASLLAHCISDLVINDTH